MRIDIINGPNLNLIGVREKAIYGETPFEVYMHTLKEQFPQHQIEYYQSNVEGEIVNRLQEVGFSSKGIILNAGAYTHSSIAIADAIAAINTPVVEVHLSNVYAREDFRQKSLLAHNCVGVIAGFGVESYTLALVHFISKA